MIRQFSDEKSTQKNYCSFQTPTPDLPQIHIYTQEGFILLLSPFFLNSFLCCIFSCEIQNMYLKLIQWDRLFFPHPWILPCSLLCTVINEITTNKQSRLPTGQAL